MVQGSGFNVSGWVWGLNVRVSVSGFRSLVFGFSFRVSGLGFHKVLKTIQFFGSRASWDLYKESAAKQDGNDVDPCFHLHLDFSLDFVPSCSAADDQAEKRYLQKFGVRSGTSDECRDARACLFLVPHRFWVSVVGKV